jgi:hypothetical protein
MHGKIGLVSVKAKWGILEGSAIDSNAAEADTCKYPLPGSPVVSFHHASGVARGADATAPTGKDHEVVVPAVITPRPRKAMRKVAAFEVFAKGLADIRLWGVVVALAVELTCAGEFMPSLEVFGNGLVEQRALGEARVVEFGLGARLPTRKRMQVQLRGTCGDGR